MRLITFTRSGASQHEIGARIPNSSGDQVLPFADVTKKLGISNFPADMRSFLRAGNGVMEQAKSWVASVEDHSALLISAKSISFLPPITDAEKFLCVGKNYRTHLEELKRTNLIKEIPQEPTSFIKLNSCLVGHEAKVVRPKGITHLDYEPELVFVMGKRALGAKKADALSYVAGVTILNDLTCRDLQLREVASGSRFWTAKNIPGFGPLGPEIVTIDEIPNVYDLWMTCSVNGQERMRVNTADQIWKISDILEHFSRFIPIEAGDMFSTGAPGGVAVGKENAEELYLKPGDVVECAIDGISVLRTTIIE
ncbi:fumarylacetoacetate hydrolase family protein [Polynucleobacter sp. AP-Melu-500A-A1]|uniref:fumarylacetoacetate hydrolase family protein n=1 Tax=Polynucleobacter sp. AP-Melu-500A-A1 TaxID=2576929 RepID=UPI001C0CB9E3|nr:fumarylacetoacetate hydrolase family protein [Polynucleobacter sp. AP-Melu-500A-A1]MBU3630814.1 fumarylacetoacetate hydrolase family protein [Polynucleobacter sp. AP-Melu-500A-A1]